MVKNDLIKKVRHFFNLNIYETKVWVALLGKGIATAGEISEISGVPRSRTYDVMEGLAKQGFAIAKIGKPVKYIAVNPSAVIERLKTNIVNEATEKAEDLAKIKTSIDYKQIEDLHKVGIQPFQPEDLSGLIKGRTNLYSYLKEIISSAEDEVLIVTNLKELTKQMKILKPLSELLKRKKVKFKIALNASEDEIQQFKELKADIFKTDLNSVFCLIDKKQLFFMLSGNQNEDEDSAIWVNSPFFSSALSSLLNSAIK